MMMIVVVVIETLLKTSASADVLLLVFTAGWLLLLVFPLRFARIPLPDIDVGLAECTAKWDWLWNAVQCVVYAKLGTGKPTQ